MAGKYQVLSDTYLNLSVLGYGDELLIEFNKEECKLRVSIFDENHFQNQIVIDLTEIKGW